MRIAKARPHHQKPDRGQRAGKQPERKRSAFHRHPRNLDERPRQFVNEQTKHLRDILLEDVAEVLFQNSVDHPS